MTSCVQVSVNASQDILGGEVSVPGSTSSVRIGTLYFDGEKLRDWMVHSGKENRALYEKMWIEGVGACACASMIRLFPHLTPPHPTHPHSTPPHPPPLCVQVPMAVL